MQGKAGKCMGLSGKDRAGQDMMARQGETGQGRAGYDGKTGRDRAGQGTGLGGVE